MSSFTNPIDSRKLPNGKRRLLTSFEYYVHSKYDNVVILVPAGFISDGATIPRFLWPIIGHPWDDYEQAAWLHDYICKHMRRTYNRKQGEKIMYDAMGALGVSKWKRKTMYRGLRMFGWYCWNKGKKNVAMAKKEV